MRALVLYTAIFSLFLSCRKDQFETGRKVSGTEFFQTDTGTSVIYTVYEIVFDDFKNTSDTSSFQMKEYCESFFNDNLGRKSYRIEQYTRLSDTSKWAFRQTLYQVSDGNMAERIEDNKRYIKLSFPVSEEAVWNTNAHNSDYINNVYYGLIGQKYTVDTLHFSEVLSVESNSIISQTKERLYKEIYAKGVGLVYRNFAYVDTDFTGKLKRGIKQTIRIKTYVP